MTNIPFNKPLVLGSEIDYVKDGIARGEFSGGGFYTERCENFLLSLTDSEKVLLTNSCTHALEMTALLLDIKEGDEIIMSSFNFVSAANAFVLRGARIVFVDIRADTLNIDEGLIEDAITERTRAILVMHYGGVACEMDTIMEIAARAQLAVIEDAAHCIDSYYKGRHLGSIGDFGALSFHATKNIQCGEGGALLINNPRFIERAEIIREKGTNRKQFTEGIVDKYSWVDIGSSYLSSELNAAFLLKQLEFTSNVTKKRLSLSKRYKNKLEQISSLQVPKFLGNGHIFYFLLDSEEERTNMTKALKNRGISAPFHYIPLHSSKAGEIFSDQETDLEVTDKISSTLIRLPLYYDLKKNEQEFVIETIDGLVK